VATVKAEAHHGDEGLVNGGEDADERRHDQHCRRGEERHAVNEMTHEDGVDDAVVPPEQGDHPGLPDQVHMLVEPDGSAQDPVDGQVVAGPKQEKPCQRQGIERRQHGQDRPFTRHAPWPAERRPQKSGTPPAHAGVSGRGYRPLRLEGSNGAGEEIRTLDPNLGKVAL
jgi:hypothetical protein